MSQKVFELSRLEFPNQLHRRLAIVNMPLMNDPYSMVGSYGEPLSVIVDAEQGKHVA